MYEKGYIQLGDIAPGLFFQNEKIAEAITRELNVKVFPVVSITHPEFGRVCGHVTSDEVRQKLTDHWGNDLSLAEGFFVLTGSIFVPKDGHQPIQLSEELYRPFFNED